MVTAFICGLVLNVTIDTKDVENDGIHTHLLKASQVRKSDCPKGKLILVTLANPTFISYNSYKPLGKEGQQLVVKLSAECTKGYNVDEATSDRMGQWVSYVTWTCDATDLEVVRGPQ